MIINLEPYIFFLIALISGNTLFAKNTFRATIKDAETSEPLPYATAVVNGTVNGNATDLNGFVTIQNIPGGEQTIEFSCIGYETEQQKLTFPLSDSDTIVVVLNTSASELGEVVISSTRSNRSIANIPTRIEFIGMEEIEENGMRYQNPLTPKHTVSAVSMYEAEGEWRIGLEAYYTSKQPLSDGATGRPYWILGAMIEKIWKHFSIYANCENLTDIRQTRFGSIYTGTITNPVFKDIYAPLDGFVVNAGIKFKL
ncbi:MAG: TonB-dependent receptor [Tannerella sp.]|jgi:hypothetical protein|nr:TonB-dependent receptor [Tannerella sp.]